MPPSTARPRGPPLTSGQRWSRALQRCRRGADIAPDGGTSDIARPEGHAVIGAALDALHERLLAAVGPGAPTLTIAVGRARAIADGLVEQARLEAAGEAFAGPSLAALAAAGRITPAGVT